MGCFTVCWAATMARSMAWRIDPGARHEPPNVELSHETGALRHGVVDQLSLMISPSALRCIFANALPLPPSGREDGMRIRSGRPREPMVAMIPG